MKALHEKSMQVLELIEYAEARTATAIEISESLALGFPELIAKYRKQAADHQAAKRRLWSYYFSIQSQIYEQILKNV
jgi:tRNA G37 N-methylase TrmD